MHMRAKSIASIGPVAVLISVGIHVLQGGTVELVKLLTAGSYIQIITTSMEYFTQARQQWRDLAAECLNIDKVLRLPDAPPLARSADGAIRVSGGGSFGWPRKPPQRYTVSGSTDPSALPGAGSILDQACMPQIYIQF